MFYLKNNFTLDEKLEIFYEPDTEAEDFEKNLKASLDRDIHAKTTGVGPHRDDLKFLLTDDKPIDARIYGSQGQQRTAALSLKLAEIKLVEKIAGSTPILLLDDVLCPTVDLKVRLLRVFRAAPFNSALHFLFTVLLECSYTLVI